MWNQVKTVLLLGLLSVLLIVAGGALGEGFLVLAFGLALALNVGAYFWSDKVVLKLHRARELSEAEAPRLHAMVQELAAAARIPVPRLYRIADPQANAFATGRNPSHGVVAVTDGLLRVLDERQVRGVIAHEIAHIKNRDILVSTVAAVLASAVSWIGNAVQFSMFFGGRDDEDGGSPIGALVAAIVAPIAAVLVQLAVSRSREYLADATAAELTGDPEALAGALERLERAAATIPSATASSPVASLYIVHPLRGGMRGLFSTHPPTAERVRRLRAGRPSFRAA